MPNRRRPCLGHRDPAQPGLRVVERTECDVALARRRDVAGGERRPHVSQLARRDVGPHADEPRRTHRQPRQVQRIVAGVVGQPGLGHDHRAAVQVALGVLDGDDVRVRRHRADGVPLDRHHGARRDVVQHVGQRGGVGDRGEVRDQARLRRPRVVRRHDQQAVRALRLARLCQMHAVGGVVGAGACDDPGAVADGLEHGAQQRDLLVVGRSWAIHPWCPRPPDRRTRRRPGASPPSSRRPDQASRPGRTASPWQSARCPGVR